MIPGKDLNSYVRRPSWEKARIEGKQSDGYGASEQKELESPACSPAPAVRTKPACLRRETLTARARIEAARVLSPQRGPIGANAISSGADAESRAASRSRLRMVTPGLDAPKRRAVHTTVSAIAGMRYGAGYMVRVENARFATNDPSPLSTRMHANGAISQSRIETMAERREMVLDTHLRLV